MTPRQSASANITFDELLRHNEEETEHWHSWFQQHPDALNVPLDMADAKDVRGMLVHIFAVEFLYTERMVGHVRERISPEDFPSGSVDELFGIGASARQKFREFLSNWSDQDWNETVTFRTLSSGSKSATRRKCYVHALLHSMRHWAQLASRLRQAGFKQDWGHDFLYTQALP
jgi:uncharacterized damage-inducible protein DinB